MESSRVETFLSPRWGSREQEGPLDPGLAPWANFLRPFGPFSVCLRSETLTRSGNHPNHHFAVAHPLNL